MSTNDPTDLETTLEVIARQAQRLRTRVDAILGDPSMAEPAGQPIGAPSSAPSREASTQSPPIGEPPDGAPSRDAPPAGPPVGDPPGDAPTREAPPPNEDAPPQEAPPPNEDAPPQEAPPPNEDAPPQEDPGPPEAPRDDSPPHAPPPAGDPNELRRSEAASPRDIARWEVDGGALRTDRPSTGKRRRSGVRSKQSRRIRVVVVEDDDDARAMLRFLLEARGFEVVAEANDGPTAVKAIQRAQPDVALIDLELPHFDGVEVVQRLRSNDCTTNLIALTGHGDLETRRATCDAGFDAHLVKPFDDADLALVLEMVISSESEASEQTA